MRQDNGAFLKIWQINLDVADLSCELLGSVQISNSDCLKLKVE